MEGRFLSQREVVITSETLRDFSEDDVWGIYSASSEVINAGTGGISNSAAAAASKRSWLPKSRIVMMPSSKSKQEIAATTSPACSSAPVNIPDWSKILRNAESPMNSRKNGNGFFYPDEEAFGYDDEDEEEEEVEEGGNGVMMTKKRMIPPHEYLARSQKNQQMALGGSGSFSVHEGIGRTLKGSDLRRVRNAVWQQIGFQD